MKQAEAANEIISRMTAPERPDAWERAIMWGRAVEFAENATAAETANRALRARIDAERASSYVPPVWPAAEFE